MVVRRPQYRGALFRSFAVIHIVRDPAGWKMETKQAREWTSVLQVGGTIIRVLSAAAKLLNFQGLTSLENTGMNWPNPQDWLYPFPSADLAHAAAARSRSRFNSLFAAISLWIFGPFDYADAWDDPHAWGNRLTFAGIPAEIVSEIARSFIVSPNVPRLGAIIDARENGCPWPHWVVALEKARVPLLFYFGPSLSGPPNLDARWKSYTPNNEDIRQHVSIRRFEGEHWRVDLNGTSHQPDLPPEPTDIEYDYDPDNSRSSYAPFGSGQYPGEHPLHWLRRVVARRQQQIDSETPNLLNERLTAENIWAVHLPKREDMNIFLWIWRSVNTGDGKSPYYVRERVRKDQLPYLSPDDWPPQWRFFNHFACSIDFCDLFDCDILGRAAASLRESIPAHNVEDDLLASEIPLDDPRVPQVDLHRSYYGGHASLHAHAVQEPGTHTSPELVLQSGMADRYREDASQ